MSSILLFFREQLFGKPVAPTKSMAGRTVIITGGNTGLGLQTAIHMAKLHPSKLIITSRNASKGAGAVKQIKDATGFDAEVWELDLGSFSNVRAFAEKCKSLDRLDCVIENAGVAGLDWSVTKEGWETALQTNDISTGLLGALLLPLLEKTARMPIPDASAHYRPHLTLVGSEVHHWAQFKEHKSQGSILEAMNTEKGFDKNERYMASKLLNIFIAQGLSALPSAAGITVNVVNPGLCLSELRREVRGPQAAIANFLARTGEVGARNIAWAAVSDTSPTPAAYISVSSIKPPSKFVRSEEGKVASGRVWRELCQEWIKVAPEVRPVLTRVQ